MRILVIADHNGQALDASIRPVLTAARELAAAHSAGGIDLLLASAADPTADGLQAAAAALPGVDRLLVARGEAHAVLLAEPLADQVLACVQGAAESYAAVLTAATTTGKNLMPRLAGLMDQGALSDVVAVKGARSFVRPIYAGNVMATVTCHDPILLMTIRPTAFDAIEGAGQPEVVSLTAVATSARSHFVSMESSASDRPELGSARVVVSGGRGLGSAESYQQLLSPLADALKAAMGASRAAVDAGYAPNDYQVGQTGKIVAPQLYIAVGMSGAIQHLAGMKDSKVIVAINKDPDAPIFQVADYGLVADLFEAVPALTQAVQS